MRNPLLASLKWTANAVSGHGLGQIKPIRKTYNFIYGLLKPRRVTVLGHRMWLDEKDTLELATREIYEPMETGLFQREIQPGQTVLDLGANIGYYTLIAARQVGPEGRVFAFEPDPVNFRLLKKNVEQNGYRNVTLVNQAVSRKTGQARLYLNDLNRGDHRIYDSKDGRPSLSIRTTTLDAFFKKLDKQVHFIKMDIQGAEASALEGMKGLLKANPGLKLVAEFSPRSLKLFGGDPVKFLKALERQGFKLSEVSEKDQTVKPVRPLQLLYRYRAETDDYTNLYCVKGK